MAGVVEYSVRFFTVLTVVECCVCFWRERKMADFVGGQRFELIEVGDGDIY